jgi:hypothetical protein
MYRFFLFQLLVGVLGGYIASKKGRNPLFWGLACFVFPLMVLVIGILPSPHAERPNSAPTAGKCFRKQT